MSIDNFAHLYAMSRLLVRDINNSITVYSSDSALSDSSDKLKTFARALVAHIETSEHAHNAMHAICYYAIEELSLAASERACSQDIQDLFFNHC